MEVVCDIWVSLTYSSKVLIVCSLKHSVAHSSKVNVRCIQFHCMNCIYWHSDTIFVVCIAVGNKVSAE